MWAARVWRRSDECMRRRTCQSCKAVNSEELLPVPFQKQVAFAMLLVAGDLFSGDQSLVCSCNWPRRRRLKPRPTGNRE